MKTNNCINDQQNPERYVGGGYISSHAKEREEYSGWKGPQTEFDC